MSWPTTLVPTVHLDQGSDRLDLARADIYTAVQHVNTMIGARGVANGVASLDSSALIPVSQLSGAAILSVLLKVDGPGSLLDADLLDGLDSTAFVRANGATIMQLTQGDLRVRRSINNAGGMTILTMRGEVAEGVTPGNSFSAGLTMELHDHTRTPRAAGHILWQWQDQPTSRAASLSFVGPAANNVYYLALRLRAVQDGFVLEMPNVGSPSTSPPDNHRWLYPTAEGWAVKHGTVETLLGQGGGDGGPIDHGALEGLNDPDDHPWAYTHDGARTMTGNVRLGTDVLIEFTDLGGDPPLPSAFKTQLYTKAGNLFLQTTGGPIGPFAPYSGTLVHSELSALAVGNDHPQYLLRQPTADVVINDAGSDYHFRIKSVGNSSMFALDAEHNAIGIGTGIFHGGDYTMEVWGQGRVAGAIRIDSNKHGVAVESVGEDAVSYYGITNSGRAALFERLSTATPTKALVRIAETSTGGHTLLEIVQPVATATAFEVQSGASNTPALRVTGGGVVVVNPTSSAVPSFIVNGQTANLFRVAAATNVVQIGTSTLTAGMLNVQATSALHGVTAAASTAGVFAGMFTGNGAGGGVAVSINGSGTGLSVSSLATGRAAVIQRINAAGTLPTMTLGTTSATDATNLLDLHHEGTGAFIACRAAGGSSVAPNDFILWRNSVLDCTENASDPAAPATGRWRMYFKAGGLFLRTAAGTVIGPILPVSGGGGASGTDRAIQYKLGSDFAGDANLLWTSSSVLAVTGRIVVAASGGAGVGVTSGGTLVGVDITHSSSASAINVVNTGTGRAMYLNRNNEALNSVAHIRQSHVSCTAPVLVLNGYGTGRILECLDADTACFRVEDGGTLWLLPRASAPSGTAGRIYANSGDGRLYYHNGSTFIDLTATGSTSPGGSNTHVQFNNSTAFGGSANFTWNNSTNVLAVNGDVRIGDDSISRGIVLAATPLTTTYDAGSQTLSILGTSDVARLIAKSDGADGMLVLDSGGWLGWCSTDDAGGTVDRRIVRHGANGFAFQDGSSNPASIAVRGVEATRLIRTAWSNGGTTPLHHAAVSAQISLAPSGTFAAPFQASEFGVFLSTAHTFAAPIKTADLFVSSSGTGTVASVEGVSLYVTSTGAATFTDVALIRMGVAFSSGAIATLRGLHLPAVSGVTPTTTHPIYSEWLGTSYFAGRVETATDVRLLGTSSGSVAIAAPAAGDAWTMILPPNDGASGQVLRTDGNGVCSWVAPLVSVGTSGRIQMSNGAGGLTFSDGLLYTASAGALITAPAATAAAIQARGAASQSVVIFRVVQNDNTVLFSITPEGQIRSNQPEATAATPGAPTYRLPIYSVSGGSAGVLRGYIPIIPAGNWT